MMCYKLRIKESYLHANKKEAVIKQSPLFCLVKNYFYFKAAFNSVYPPSLR